MRDEPSASLGWFRVPTDPNWNPTWERSHCGMCTSLRAELYRRSDGWYWATGTSRLFHDRHDFGPYPTWAAAADACVENTPDLCPHEDSEPR